LNLWYSATSADNITVVTPDGAISNHTLPIGAHPYGMARGPDDKMWFLQNGGNLVSRIDTTTFQIDSFPILTANSHTPGSTAGMDGNIGFYEVGGPNPDQIGKCDVSGNITEYAVPSQGAFIQGITAGPDGNLWFTELSTSKIGKITTMGMITEINPIT